MSLFFSEAKEVSPLHIQLDPGTGGSTGLLLEYTAGTNTAVGGYSIPVLTREDLVDPERGTPLGVLCRSGFAAPRCRVWDGIPTSDAGPIIANVIPFFIHWAVPSPRHAFVVGPGGGVRLSAKSVDTTWTATLLWEEV